MERSWLLARLAGYQGYDDAERQHVEQLREFVDREEHCLDRTRCRDRVTGSAWVLDGSGQFALMTHHRKLDRWLQLGGHLEDDADVLASALREAREESGVAAITAVSDEIFDVDIHPIPGRGDQPRHLHYDVRFLFRAEGRPGLRASAESKAVAWVALDRVVDLAPGDSIRRMVEKTKKASAYRGA